MENKEEQNLWLRLLDDSNKEEKPLKWYYKLNFYMLGFILFLLMGNSYKRNISAKDKISKKLRYFNPIIKKGFWGNNIIEWVGRDKPLTDEELNKLL